MLFKYVYVLCFLIEFKFEDSVKNVICWYYEIILYFKYFIGRIMFEI